MNNIVVNGIGTYIFSFFVKPLQDQFNWDRGVIMTAFMLNFISMGIGQFFAGRLIDRHGARKIISSGGILMALGLILASIMTQLWQLYVGWIMVGLGAAAAGTLPGSLVVSNWFKVKRGLAIGIMSAGVGIGGMVMSPLVGNYLIPVLGWNATFLTLAILALVILVPLAWLVIRTKPSDMGLTPDGTNSLTKAKTFNIVSLSSSGMTLKEALVTPAIWLIAFAFFISAFAFMAILQNVVPHLQDMKYPLAMVTVAMSVISLGSALGKFGFGWLSDRIPAKYTATIGMALQLCGIVLFILIGSASRTPLVWVSVILLGLGIGSWLPTMSIITGRQFGLKSYGSIFGIVIMFQTFGSALGPLFAAQLYDNIGNYHWAFIISTLSYVISIPFVLMLKNRLNTKGR